jgi:hypothetical protein
VTATRPLAEWAEIVRGDLTQAVEGLLAAGRSLREAKAEHPGEFVRWVDSGAVGIGIRQVQRLMVISGRLAGLNATRRVALPRDSLVLYGVATRYSRKELERVIDSGRVHPGLKRDGLRELLAQESGSAPSEPIQLVLVQQTWTKGGGYSPKPKGGTGRPRAQYLGRETPPVWAKLVAEANLNVAALDRGDRKEWLKLQETVQAHVLQADLTLSVGSGALGATR